jgi:hypothetical protein
MKSSEVKAMTRSFIACCVGVLLFAGCVEDPPTAVDGNATLVITALWEPAVAGAPGGVFIPLPNAKVILMSEYGMMVRQTGPDGVLRLEKLPSAHYSVSVRKAHPDDPSIQLVGSSLDLPVTSGETVADTIMTKAISSTGISINELYVGGPVNSMFFFFDQYIELYNASDSVRYLDGMLIMRVTGTSDLGIKPGEDGGNDGDIDGIGYPFRFPGTPGGTQYPIFPGQFIVLASDAVNHSTVVAAAQDLSRADWEFYNQYSPEDIDNPSVPNLYNMRSDRTADFLINLTSDVIVISSGVDSVWVDGIDISTIIDGVEYQSNPPPTSEKTLDARVDRGYILSPPRYGGKSMQRREPGSDSNDGTIDFEIINSPTPGRQ